MGAGSGLGVPKMESAFATSADMLNVKIKVTTIFAIFIFFSFQKVLIFTPRTVRSFTYLVLS
jgi:hypothetical protein